eukprot:COSAG02_NODE_3679_length_6390_cov_3.572405_6_plen_246_part_00
MTALLGRVTFTIIPQISPDGADFCARTSASVRSIPYDPAHFESNVIYPADVDGDGLALTMRVEHPDGEFVLDPEDSRLLIRRKADDSGPYYRQFPEGEIFEWDGDWDHIKVPREYGQFASDTAGTGGTYTDFNRNWPTGWEPEPVQGGAGHYPGAEPEMAALFAWIHSHPKLFGVLGYHSGVFCLLHSPADPKGITDGLDHSLVASVARKGAKILGMEAIPPYRLHSSGARDQQYHGDPFDFFCP